MPASELNAAVSHKIEVSPNLIILQVRADGWELPDFIPGQFTLLGLPGSAPRYRFSDPEETPPDPDKLIRRAYSISSSSVEKEYVEFYITHVSSGALTPRLFALKVGDRVMLGKKFTGMFTLSDIPKDSNVVMIATGTGLAPYMSMIRTELEHGIERRIAVLHGAKHSWDLGYRSELTTMQRLCPNFTYFPIVSDPQDEPVAWSGDAGFMSVLWESDQIENAWGRKPDPADTHIFLCGNPLMIEGMLTLLEKDDFYEQTKEKPGQVHLEHYW